MLKYVERQHDAIGAKSGDSCQVKCDANERARGRRTTTANAGNTTRKANPKPRGNAKNDKPDAKHQQQ